MRNTFTNAFLGYPYEPMAALPAGDRDLVVMVGKKNCEQAVRELCDYPGRIVAAISPGDIGVGPEQLGRWKRLPPHVVALFTVNNRLTDERAVSVPIGVRATNLAAMAHARKTHDGGRKDLCYGSFTANRAVYRDDESGKPHIRFRLADRLSDASWVELDVSRRPRTAAADLERYYSQMARHRFVLSPEGHGADCYRTWEALYLGAVPIVMRSRPMSAFADLPILFTDDYGELSEEYLERRWREMSQRSFEPDRMIGSWYRRRFQEAAAALRDPRFVCLWVDDSASAESVQRLLQPADAIPVPARRAQKQ